MKGWVKGMLIASAACIGTGTVLCLGAWGMGGRFSYYRDKSFGITRERSDRDAKEIAAADELREAEVYEEDAAVNRESEPKSDASSQALTSRGAEAKSGGTVVKKLEIQVMGGWVEIVNDDSTDQIVVTSSNEDYVCRQELEEDTLEIYVGLNSKVDFNLDHWLDGSAWQEWADGIGNKDPAAQIRIPAGVSFKQVDLEVKAGGISAEGLTSEKLDLETDAGILEVGEGNVQELDGECRAGELIFEGSVGREMKAECQTGSIQYRIDGSREDFWYEVEAKAGSILIDGKEEGILNRESIIENPGAAKKATLECRAGAVDVSFQQ